MSTGTRWSFHPFSKTLRLRFCTFIDASGDLGAGQLASFVYEYERLRVGTATIGVSPQAVENGRQLRERVYRDAQVDQPVHRDHDTFWADPYEVSPVRLINDPNCSLARLVGAEAPAHWNGPMVLPTTFLVDSNGVIRFAFQSGRRHGERVWSRSVLWPLL